MNIFPFTIAILWIYISAD